MWEPRVETEESAREPLVDPEVPMRADPCDLNLSGDASVGRIVGIVGHVSSQVEGGVI